MIIFRYDKTFEGLLSCVFSAYEQKCFPEMLLDETEIPPLFYDKILQIETVKCKAERVWQHLEKKLSPLALRSITNCWLADTYPKVDELLFRYICKTVNSEKSIEVNFGDPDVLEISKVYKQISYERLRILQFVRFQKTKDNIYFAAFEPLFDVLQLTIDHFTDRFADQKWLIYDMTRNYGYFYDLEKTNKVIFTEKGEALKSGLLNEEIMSDDEQLFKDLWRTYFKAIAIKERKNPRKQRQDMPVRYWKYLTEKQ